MAGKGIKRPERGISLRAFAPNAARLQARSMSDAAFAPQSPAPILAALEKGEQSLLDLDGFGRKSLSDLKKALRKFGYELPEAADELAV